MKSANKRIAMRKLETAGMRLKVLLLVCFLLIHGFNAGAKAETPFFESGFESEAEFRENLRLDKIESHAWEVTDKAKHFGKNGLVITVNKGDKPYNNTERSEVQDPLKVPLDEESWYRIDFKIPKDFPEIDNRLVIWQLKQAGKDNPLIGMNYADGKLLLKQSFDDNKINYYQPKEYFKDRWLRVVVYAKASHSDEGFIDVFLNDTKIVEYKGQTAHHNKWEEETYFKFGLYRDAIDIPMHMYFDQYMRGSSWNEVVPEDRDAKIEKRLWRIKIK